jgi:hypothetical protein
VRLLEQTGTWKDTCDVASIRKGNYDQINQAVARLGVDPFRWIPDSFKLYPTSPTSPRLEFPPLCAPQQCPYRLLPLDLQDRAECESPSAARRAATRSYDATGNIRVQHVDGAVSCHPVAILILHVLQCVLAPSWSHHETSIPSIACCQARSRSRMPKLSQRGLRARAMRGRKRFSRGRSIRCAILRLLQVQNKVRLRMGRSASHFISGRRSPK